MKYLQLLVGGLHDALAARPDGHRFLDAVSIACFGVFPNVATVIIIAASGITYFAPVNSGLLSFPGSKILWLFLMGLIFTILINLRDRILATDRARFATRANLKVFLLLYYLLSYVALLGAYILYASV